MVTEARSGMRDSYCTSSSLTNGPLVTIAIPTYNRALWLGDCVIAALSQTYRHLEVLVSDNASTDETVEVLRQFRDPRLRVLTQKSNIGLLPNWNACLTEAKGNYIVFVSDDDTIAPRMLERCMVLVKREPQIPIILGLSEICEEGRMWQVTHHSKFETGVWEGTDLLLEYFKENIAPQMCSIMFQADALRTIGGFPIGLPNLGADTAAWVSLLLTGRAGLVNEPCATFFKHGASETSSLTMEQCLNHLRTLINFIESKANLSIADPRRRRQVNEGARVFFARQLVSGLCHLRRKGCKLSEAGHFIWRWRHDLRHIGGAEIFWLARKIAVIVFPKLTDWIRCLIPSPHALSTSPRISGNG